MPLVQEAGDRYSQLRLPMRDARCPGWIQLRGLRCTGRHGTSPAEQATPSAFLVDLSAYADLGPAAASDDLAEAVDVALLTASVREVVGGPSRALLETLVVAIARLVLERVAAVQTVRVRVAKAEPAGLDAAEEAVEVSLERSDAGG